jgi:hypothetical protein
MEESLQWIVSSLPLLSSSLLLIVVLSLLLHNVGHDELVGIPFIGKELGGLRKRQKQFMANGRNMMRDGYRQVSTFCVSEYGGAYNVKVKSL